MNTQNIKQLLKQLKESDIRQKIILSNPNMKSENIQVGEWKLPKFMHLFNRLIVQFEAFLETEEAEYLSEYLLIIELENANNSVTNYIHNVLDKIERQDWNEVQRSIKWLIAYQVFYDFWNKSKYKIHDVDTLKINEAADVIDLAVLDTEKLIKSLSEKLGTIDTKTNELQQFIEQKQKDVSLIVEKRDEILNKLSEVNQAYNDANSLKNQIESAKESSIKYEEEIKLYLENEKKILDTFNEEIRLNNKEIVKLIEQNEGRIEAIDEDYEHVKSKKEFIDLKETEIIKLAALASGGSLGHAFGTRQENLGKSAKTWMWLTFGMIVILFIWIFVVFSYLNEGTFSPEWVKPLVGTLKTIPAFIILAFVARQYTKERNLQEEYAFKSSIALTLNAFADSIGREEDEDRRELIKDSVGKVYQSPKITSEKMSLLGLSSKQKREYFETMTNTIKDVVEKTSKAGK